MNRLKIRFMQITDIRICAMHNFISINNILYNEKQFLKMSKHNFVSIISDSRKFIGMYNYAQDCSLILVNRN